MAISNFLTIDKFISTDTKRCIKLGNNEKSLIGYVKL